MKVNRSCWCTLSPTKGLELTSWTFLKYKSQFMERSVYACKAMLLLRLNYFELKVLRVHCTGGVFALRTLSAVNAELHRICIENWCFLWRRSLTATGQSVESVEESSLCFQKFHTVPALHDAFTVTHLSQLQLQSHHQTWFSTFLGGQSQGTEDVFLIISNVIPSSLTDSHLLYLKDVCKLPKLT